eukprot:Skav224606  [mRNA]  locus=scaffold3477:39753:40409:- [translate_table: standard]
MEDFHFALRSLGGDWSDTAAFGVLDGHGGREVALFCQQRLPTAISKAPLRRKDPETKVSHFLSDKLLSVAAMDDTPTGHTRENAAHAAAAGKALVSALESMDKMLESLGEY